ncbi:MAG TPA: amidohydrolase [Acidobacteriota bacterium]|nr:amidohydrolase [Acidobacteriota bacterium]HRV08303.1 amidohydrolase [Acidobacteriota bacterium]
MLSRYTMLTFVFTGVVGLAFAQEDPPDIIFHSGKIVTVDPAFSIAEAMAVRADRIVAVGGRTQVEQLAGTETRRIDLHGKVVLPGLIDSHLHAPAASVYEFDHEVPEMETIADVLNYVRSRGEQLEDGQWILVSQVFVTRLREQRYPTRAELDAAAPRNPVVFRTGPDASLNSLALKLSGIDRDFQVTDGQPCRVERDADGEPTGILRSCARFIKYVNPGREPTREERIERLRLLLADYNSVGLTSIVDGDTSDEEVGLYEALKERGQLTCRTFVALSVDAQMPIEQIRERIREAAAHPLRRYDNVLWLGAVKSYLDGGMLTGSAYMRQPWGISKVFSIEDPEYRGMLFIEPDKLYEIMKEALRNDLQFTAHSVGDGAVHAFIDAAERINRQDFPVRDKRPCIVHSNFTSLEAIRKMAQLGVVANLQPSWLWLDAATLVKQFGWERLAYFQPYRTIFEEGAIVGGGSDHMQKIGSFRSVNPYNPFLGMWITLTRQGRRLDGVLHPEQIITREQAIRLYTINNAYLTFEEKEKGSLEPGKLADFIILDRDILTCPVDEVKSIQVEQTWIGGRPVYTKEAVQR